MSPPAVDSSSASVARPRVTGRWSEGAASSLSVTVDGTAYVLGTDEALTSDSGAWTLALPRPLKDGTYDVVAETTDAAGTVLRDETANELTVDAAGPAVPTVTLYAGEESPATVTGTWAEGDATRLSVTLNGNSATLGSDTTLTSDGQGRWTLAMPAPLEPGSYDVTVTTADARRRIATDQTRFEILVKRKPEPEPQPTPVPQPAPVDCETEFANILIISSIHFASDSAGVRTDSLATMAKLAGVAKACPDARLEVAGHTDDVGSRIYNQALSERRAVTVVKALARQGVNFARMTARGYGEERPLATNATEEGRTINRRIEITVIE